MVRAGVQEYRAGFVCVCVAVGYSCVAVVWGIEQENEGGRKSKVQRGEGGQTECEGVILSRPVYHSGLSHAHSEPGIVMLTLIL